MSTILTGIKANGELHLGHYFGVINHAIKAQNKLTEQDKFFLFVPDLHSFTTPIDFQSLYQNTLDNVRVYLAAGLDPVRDFNFIYRQSYVPAHSELAWILSCFTYFGEASRLIQFKEKSVQHGQSVTVGLMTYPILMAADILLYEADYIPLGDDQKQHLEIARDIAIRINHKFADTFQEGVFKTIPKPWAEQLTYFAQEEGIRIRSLASPEKKMSKSVSDPKGTILLSDKPEEAVKKIMSATTDSLAKIAWDWLNQPGITNLMQLLALLTNQSNQQVRAKWENLEKYGDLKKAVAQEVDQFLTNFQTKMLAIEEKDILNVLASGELKANNLASQTLKRVQIAVGLRR